MTTVRNRKIKTAQDLEKIYGPLTFGGLLEAHRKVEEMLRRENLDYRVGLVS